MHNKALGGISITGLLLLLAWMIIFWQPGGNRGSEEHSIPELAATPAGGDFIVDIQNDTLALKDLRGEVVILYFGYTLCPDICPTSLAFLSGALQQMTETELEQLQSIFISVDPKRDNATRLAEYTKYFHPNLIGATSDQNEIDRITKLYGAAYRIAGNQSAAGYLVDHSSYTYLIDKQGKLRYSLEHGTKPATILSHVRELLSESSV